jgi:hypothetical protein
MSKKAWEDWQARVGQHPDDKELHTLHALWLGLCVKVERGDLAFDEASALFEQTRRTLNYRIRDKSPGNHRKISYLIINILTAITGCLH